MNTLYLDCSTGVSGDMLLASLAHLLEGVKGKGAGFQYLEDEMDRLGIEGFCLQWTRKKIGGIQTWHVDVEQTKEQPLRTYSNLISIIDGSSVSGTAADRARHAITLLGEAEAKVHGTDIESIHFHEIGAVDTIVDIVGSMVLIDALGVEKVTCSAIDLGSGFVRCAHGVMPVPAPASAELVQSLLAFGSDCGMERATPTGLAVLRSIVDSCGPMPLGTPSGVGYGSGGRSCDEQPTYVRAFLLESPEGAGSSTPPEGGCARGHNHA